MPPERKGVVIQVGSLSYDDVWPHPSDLADYKKYYDEDGAVSSGINVITAMSVGIGFYTESENDKAKEIIDKWCADVKLDQLLQNACRTYLRSGFVPIERWLVPGPPPGKLCLKMLPPESMKYRSTKKGKHLGFKQDWFDSTHLFRPQDIIWAVHQQIGLDPYGTSKVQSVLSLVKAKASINADMALIFKRYASPMTVWKSRTSIKPVKKAVTERESDHDLFLGNVTPDDVDFKVVEIDPRARFTEYIREMNDQILEGLQAPLLHYLRNATQASAGKMLEVIDAQNQGIQRYWKRVIEQDMFEIVLAHYGITDKVTLNWGAEKTGIEDVDLAGLADLVDSRVLTPTQAVDLLKKMGIPVEDVKSDDPDKDRPPLDQEPEPGKDKEPPGPPPRKNGDDEKRFEYILKVT